MSQQFRVSRIRKKRFRNSRTAVVLKSFPWQKIISVGLTVVLVVWGFLWVVSKINLGSVFSFFSGIVAEELKTDEQGRTNILVLGVGGEGHQGRDLTDSIMIVSYFHPEDTVTLVSIPRDLYIKTERFQGERINSMLEYTKEKMADEKEAIQFVQEEISHVFEIPLHYTIKLDFQGMEKVIDELKGIDVFVDEPIDDPFYPNERYGYQTFRLNAGNQHLDGETALKYVRSRKTSSDFDRAERQQKVLKAMKDKARTENILSSPSRIKHLFQATEDHLVTNFDLREMVTLATLGKDLPENHIFSYLIHDDPTKMGGFLYTPLRELYGGAFVLVPAGDEFGNVQKFIKLVTMHASLMAENVPLQVLNGTKRSGEAALTKMILKRFGFNVIRFGNSRAQDIPETTLYYKTPEPPKILEALREIIPGKDSPAIPQKYLEPQYLSEATVIIELGEDFLPLFDAMDIFRNVVPLTPSPPPSGEAVPAAKL